MKPASIAGERIGCRHAEMGAAARGDDADAELARHRHRLVDRAHADHEAEGVLAVERGGDRRYPLRLEVGAGVDQPAPDAVEIAGQAGDAVGVDAAQVGAHQTMGDDRGVRLGQAVRQHELAREGLRRLRRHIDALAGFTRGVHCV